MNTIIRLGTNIPNYKQIYSNFSQRCLTNNPDFKQVKGEFIGIKNTFLSHRQTDSFCTNTLKLAQTLIDNGNEKLANVLINEIGKIYLSMRKYGDAERLIRYSLEYSRSVNDRLHVLARLNDLEEIFRAQKNRKRIFGVLRDKKECLKEIIADYDGSVKNFQTIFRPPTSLESVKTQLAYTYSGISDMLWYRSPENSLRAVQKSKQIYEELKKQEQLIYINNKIKILTERINATAQGDKELMQ